MVQRLQDASPTFRAYWEEHNVAATANVVKQFRHPELGLLRFNATNMWLAQRVGNRLMVFTPADQPTESAYSQLAEIRPRALYEAPAASR